MIKYEDGRWYVVTEDGHRLTDGCESLGEAVRADNKVKYHMMVSQRKVERSME